MTAAVYRSGTPSLSVPQTQNTAPVLEFNCLYTHDIRRKQKRWQDGFLRFHTFNKRVMVYDVPRNFIGDAHWKADDLLQDGDEVTLEKDGVLVQVAESIGRTETDLSELRKSKKKGSSEQGSSSPARPAQTATLQGVSRHAPRQPTQLKHRSLNALLGTPKGPLGKAALPTKSPFEQRHANIENEVWEEGRAPKRQCVEQPAWNVTRTTSHGKPNSRKEAPLWARTADSAKRKKPSLPASQRRLGTKEVIDLSNESDGPDQFLPGFSSDALLPPSSPVKEQQPKSNATQTRSHSHAPPAVQLAQHADHQEAGPVRSSSPAFQTMQLPANAQQREASHAVDVLDSGPLRRQHGARVELQGREPGPTSVTGLHTDSGKKNQPPTRSRHVEPIRHQDNIGPNEMRPVQTTSSKSGQTLRMSATAAKKNKTLLCHDQLAKPSRTHSANTDSAIDALLDATSPKPASAKREPKSQRRQLQERLQKIRSKDETNLNDTVRDTRDGSEQGDMQIEIGAELRPQTPLEVNNLKLAELDQMITISKSPGLPANIETNVPERRELRRAVSESNNPGMTRPKRTPGAPIRFTPSPSKEPLAAAAKSRTSRPADGPPERPATVQPTKQKTKKPLQRAVSLDTTSNGTTTVILGKPFQAPKAPNVKQAQSDQVADPWSREAFDLFTWRPPGWDEESWCLKMGHGAENGDG